MAEDTLTDPLDEENNNVDPITPPGGGKKKNSSDRVYKRTGTYRTPAGLGTTDIPVFASAPRARKVGAFPGAPDAEPEGPEPVFDLARTKGGPFVVTGCPHSDEPLEGHWTSD